MVSFLLPTTVVLCQINFRCIYEKVEKHTENFIILYTIYILSNEQFYKYTFTPDANNQLSLDFTCSVSHK